MRLHEQIALLEKQRKILFLLQYILLPVGIVSFMFGMVFDHQDLALFIVLMCVVIAALLYFSYHCGSFKRNYKETFLNDLLREIFDDVVYDWKDGFASEEVEIMGMVQRGNRFHSEDYLRASYNGVSFEQADVTIKHVTGSGKNRHTTLYFKGRMFKFHTTVKRVVDVQVFSEGFRYRAKPYEGYHMRKVEMEEMDFNRKFDVLSVDEMEAFYVLTPPLMERIKSLRDKYGNVAFHFKPNEVYVAFNCKRDAFDAVLTEEISYPKEKARLEEDIRDIISIIETIGLSEK